jgi:hypothetical protein
MLRLFDTLLLALSRRTSWARSRMTYRALEAVVVAERSPRR